MKEIRKLIFIKIFTLAFFFTIMPNIALATNMGATEVIADSSDVSKTLDDIDVTVPYNDEEAYGIYARANNGYTANVTAKEIYVHAPKNDVLFQYGVGAFAGYDNAPGKIKITTGEIFSTDQGIYAGSQGQGSEVSIITEGNINSYNDGYDTIYVGRGIEAIANLNGKTNIEVTGAILSHHVGAEVRATDGNNKGKVNLVIYGSVIATNFNTGKGLIFNGTTDTTDVFISGSVDGGKYGVVTRTYDYYNEKLGLNKLTVWEIVASRPEYLVVKQTKWQDSHLNYKPDNEFAKKINYIIYYDDDIILKKADGRDLDLCRNGFPIAKEGDKIYILPPSGYYIEQVDNRFTPITTKENGKFYIQVKRGGGIKLSAIVKKNGDTPNPMTVKGRTIKVKALALSKKAQTKKIAKAVKILNAKGILSYQKVKGKKQITIDSNTGKITIKKGLKTGKYKVTVNVISTGDETYKPITSKVVFTISVI